MPNAFSQKTVTVDRQLIVNHDPYRTKLTIRVISGNPQIFIGDKSVTVDKGLPIYVGETVEFEGKEANDEFYALTDALTSDVRIIEQSFSGE